MKRGIGFSESLYGKLGGHLAMGEFVRTSIEARKKMGRWATLQIYREVQISDGS